MSGDGLVPFAPGELPLDGETAKREVRVSEAAADHLVAWDVDQRVKAVHEAGHAVVAHLLGIPVKAVDISDREAGSTEYGLGDDSQPAVMPDSRVLDLIVASLAGPAAERAILGQGTTGGTHDLLAATRLAYERFDAGLDPDAPFIHASGVGFNLDAQAMADDFYRAALPTLARSRERAEALVREHRESVVEFASSLYAARRLAGTELDDALRSIGEAPPAPGSARRKS